MAQPQVDNTQTINVTDPFGKIGSIPKSQANEAFDNGYKLASVDEVNQQKNEQQYGGVRGAAVAGALGALRAPTLGGSDWALTHLPENIGMSPEDIKGFSETNPKATTAGEIGGLIADPLGVGAVIGTVGRGVTAGGKAALNAAKFSADSSTVAKVLTHALGHGAEGAIYGGVANSINEDALGDSSLNGEKVLSNLGYGAVIGGVAGGAFKFLDAGITPTLRKATEGLAKIRNDLIGSGYGDEALISKALPKRFAEAITDRQLNLDTKGQAAVLRKISTNLNSVLDNLHGEVNDFNSSVDSKVMSSMFKTSSKIAREAQQTISESLSGLVDQIKTVVPDMPTKEILDTIKQKSKFDVMRGGSAQAIFNSLKGVKDHINDFMEKNSAFADALSPISDSISEKMKDPNIFGPAGAGLAMHEEAMNKFSRLIAKPGEEITPFQKTFGEMKDGKWQFDINKMHDAFSDSDEINKPKNMELLNDFYSQLKEMPESLLNARRTVPNSGWKKETLKSIIDNSEKTNEEAFKDYIEGINKRRPLYGWKDYAPVLIAKWHPVIAAAIEAYDVYQDPVHATHGLATVERMLGQTSKHTIDLIDQIFNPSFASKVKIEDKINKINKTSVQNDKDKHDFLKGLSNNPEELADNLEKSTKGINDIAPKLAQNLHLSASTALSFLSSKLPAQNDHLSAFSQPYKASATETAKFDRYRKIVEDPLLSLKQIKDGTVTPETIETLSTVYPKLYEQLKQSVLEKAYDHKTKGNNIPFRTKQSISMFLGQPLERSLYPESILANQNILANAPKPGEVAQNQMKTRAKGLDKMKSSDRATNKYSNLSDI